jgi:hypothetical protein
MPISSFLLVGIECRSSGHGAGGLVALHVAAIDGKAKAAFVNEIPASFGMLARSIKYTWEHDVFLPNVLLHYDIDEMAAGLGIPVLIAKIRQEPAYKWRRVSGDIGSTWSRRNRNNSELIPNGHNLNVLFPPSKYAKSHPEFFPILNGKRYIPPADADGNWQPCFSADGIVDEASKNIKEYFRTHAGTKYFSAHTRTLDPPLPSAVPASLGMEG